MTATRQLHKTDDCELASPRRNNYFHGKLLDAYHFKMETDYFNRKRQLINRLVNGYGVVCGLNVCVADDCKGVKIAPGVAIDQCGYEIIVPCEHTQPLPCDIGDICERAGQHESQHQQQRQSKRDDHLCKCHIVLCYCEHLSEPAPAMPGCPDGQPNVIRERFKIEYRPCHLPCPMPVPHVDLIDQFKWKPEYGLEVDFEVHYKCMVKWISEECFCPTDPCIPLANIWLECQRGEWKVTHEPPPNIYVRPIVYTNDLLRHLLFSLARIEGEQQPQSKAPQQK